MPLRPEADCRTSWEINFLRKFFIPVVLTDHNSFSSFWTPVIWLCQWEKRKDPGCRTRCWPTSAMITSVHDFSTHFHLWTAISVVNVPNSWKVKNPNKFVEFRGRAEMPNGMLMKPLKLSTNIRIHWIKMSKIVDIFIPSHGIFHDMVESILLFTSCCVSSRSVLTHHLRSCSNCFSSLQLSLRTNYLPVTQTKLIVSFSIIRQYI